MHKHRDGQDTIARIQRSEGVRKPGAGQCSEVGGRL